MFEEILHYLGLGLCHQLPERSFFAGSAQFSVCARDTGIYLGFFISFMLLQLLYRKHKPIKFPPLHVILVGLFFLGLMGIDGVTSYAGLRETTNLIRLITGLGTGFALSVIIVPIFNEMFLASKDEQKVLSNPKFFGIWLGAFAISIPVVYFVLPYLGVVYAGFSALTILFTFVVINLTLVFTLASKLAERKKTWLFLFAVITAALFLTILEIAPLALLKTVLLPPS